MSKGALSWARPWGQHLLRRSACTPSPGLGTRRQDSHALVGLQGAWLGQGRPGERWESQSRRRDGREGAPGTRVSAGCSLGSQAASLHTHTHSHMRTVGAGK